MSVVSASDNFSALDANLLCFLPVFLLAGRTEHLQSKHENKKNMFPSYLPIVVVVVSATDHDSAFAAKLLCLLPVVHLARLTKHLQSKHMLVIISSTPKYITTGR